MTKGGSLVFWFFSILGLPHFGGEVLVAARLDIFHADGRRRRRGRRRVFPN